MKFSKTSGAFVLFSLLWIPGSVFAKDNSWYTTAILGISSQSDQTLEFAANGLSQSSDSPLSSGLLAGASIGYAFESGWRLEGEFIYQSVDSKDAGLQFPAPTGDGNYASTSFAINALYDFNMFGSTEITSYLGAGLVRLTEVDIDFEDGGTERSFSGSDTGFQVLFGARYRFSERLFLDAGLRYLAASSIRLKPEGGAVGEIRADYQPWAATVGLGWQF